MHEPSRGQDGAEEQDREGTVPRLGSGNGGHEGWWTDLLGPLDAKRLSVALAARDLVALSRLEAPELAAQLGLGPLRARRLRAAFVLGHALGRASRPARPTLRSPRAVFEWLRPRALGLERETFWSLLLDGKQGLIQCVEVSSGTLTAALVHPREVFRGAIRAAAAALVVAHNHPSGDPTPSAEDLAVTERLHHAGELLGIPLQDHVVVGERAFVSLRERGPWPGPRAGASGSRSA